MVRGDPVVLLRPQRLGTAFCPVGATTSDGFVICNPPSLCHDTAAERGGARRWILGQGYSPIIKEGGFLIRNPLLVIVF
jgi:hypothetical protein